MRCIIPSISKVSLANIIFLTLFLNYSFELGFCFIPCTLYESHLLLQNCLSQPFSAFQNSAKGRHISTPLPTSLLITQSWCNCGVNETIVFHGLWAQSYFKGFSTPKFVSSVALLKYLFLSMRVSFLLSFTMIRSVLFLFLQGFNYLITYPQGNYFHLLNTVLQLFQLFGKKHFFNVNGNI